MMGELLVGAVPAVYYETVQAAFSAVEDAGESDPAGAAAADVLEAFVDMLQPGSPLGTWLAGAIVSECCGAAVVLAPLTRTHAQTRAVAIRLLTALMPRSREIDAADTHDAGDGKHQMAPPGSHVRGRRGARSIPADTRHTGGAVRAHARGPAVPAVAAPVAKGSKPSSKSSTFGGVSVASARAAAKYAAGRFFASVSSSGSAGAVQMSKGTLLEPVAGSSTSGVPGIVHASAAGLLLRLLEKSEESEMRAGVLELILSLVEGAAGNAHAVLGQAGWQQWLMPVFTKSVDEERALALRLFRALHTHAVLRVEGGAGVVETTAAVVAAAGDRNQLNAPASLRTLLADLFEGLLEQTLPPPPSEDAGDVSSASWTSTLAAAPCCDNLWSLLPLVTELSPEQGLAAETLRMCEGAWSALEALAPTVKSNNGARGTPGHSRQNSMVLDGHDVDFGSTEDLPRKKLAAQRPAQRAALQRVAFRLIVAYIREAPSPMAESATNKLETLLGSILPSAPMSNEERESTSARLHWFLAALVRAENDLAPSSPERAALAGRLVGAAVGRGKDVLHGDGGGSHRGGVVPGGGSVRASAVAAAVMTTSGSDGGDPLRGLISEQKPPREPRSTPRRAAGLPRLAEPRASAPLRRRLRHITTSEPPSAVYSSAEPR